MMMVMYVVHVHLNVYQERNKSFPVPKHEIVFVIAAHLVLILMEVYVMFVPNVILANISLMHALLLKIL